MEHYIHVTVFSVHFKFPKSIKKNSKLDIHSSSN